MVLSQSTNRGLQSSVRFSRAIHPYPFTQFESRSIGPQQGRRISLPFNRESKDRQISRSILFDSQALSGDGEFP